jgi:predicted membrane channel-forming protein YqfA (hemolysin III family)
MHIPPLAPVSNIWSANRGYRVNEMIPANKRLQSFAEEIANCISHGIALVACLIATPVLINSAFRPGDAWGVVGVSIFAGAYTAGVAFYAAERIA